MDEAVPDNPTSETDQSPEHLKKLADLEEARKMLFDDAYVPDSRRGSVYSNGPRAGQLDLRDRAMLSMNNLSNYLPGGGRYSEALRGEGTPFSAAFVRDFAEAATELGIDMGKVEEMNVDTSLEHANSSSETFSLLELYKYVFPAVEKLVKEKDYPVTY